ncbi:uncharacterized protein LOC115272504 [Suricata suricatta]|uniref:uncharacterized protein LOC115272504 n=1 Tax=Suricata suricatta TaxID=37032 RepID=UPI001156A96D|nr:uncharacterized protein LOC115272504 [Suricata suricatta]
MLASPLRSLDFYKLSLVLSEAFSRLDRGYGSWERISQKRDSYGGIKLGQIAYTFFKSSTVPDGSLGCLSLNSLGSVTPSVTAVVHLYDHPGRTNTLQMLTNAPQSEPCFCFLSLPRSALESPEDTPTFNEEQLRLLLAALVKDYVLMKATEVQQEQEMEGSRVTVQKRSCSSATCVAHWLGGLLSKAGSVAHTNLLPTSMGFKVYNRRRRDFGLKK